MGGGTGGSNVPMLIDERGLALGATYTLAPGLQLIASYLYGTRHQGDFDFATSTVGSANNTVQAQLLSAGMVVKW